MKKKQKKKKEYRRDLETTEKDVLENQYRPESYNLCR